jgi:metal-responsive CopG/Arc/MetJ family transcriptional regulator
MKQILVQLDDRTAQQLEAAVPARSRKRSEFIRQAIAKALLELAERSTRAAYARMPDDKAQFNAAEWADANEALRLPRRRRRS